MLDQKHEKKKTGTDDGINSSRKLVKLAKIHSYEDGTLNGSNTSEPRRKQGLICVQKQ